MPKPLNPNPRIGRILAVWILAWTQSQASGPVRPTPPRASSMTAEELVHGLESSYRGLKTLRAKFSQTYIWGARKRVESGMAYFARGGLMRWDYQEPVRKLFLSDGKKLYLYVPEENQLTRSKLKSSEDIRVPFLLMVSRPNLHKVFSRIEIAGHEAVRDPSDFVLRAFPKPEHAEEFQQVLIELSPEFEIRRLVLQSDNRSTMEFTFDHIERNVALNPALFRFTVPAGAEVIDQQ